jgi:hypothetical protein
MRSDYKEALGCLKINNYIVITILVATLDVLIPSIKKIISDDNKKKLQSSKDG